MRSGPGYFTSMVISSRGPVSRTDGQLWAQVAAGVVGPAGRGGYSDADEFGSDDEW
jgi:hypothetical protein